MIIENISPEELASWDRMSKAFTAAEKAKKAKDKAESKYPTGHPRMIKAYADHKKAEEEAKAAAEHAASFAKARKGIKEDMERIEERDVKVIDARPKNHGGIRPGDTVEHPQHGKGVVQHLDHVHDEVVFKNKSGDFVGTHHSELKKVNEAMDRNQIVAAILSKDANKLAEAKGAIRAMLDARAAQFRQDSSKFVARSLFEADSRRMNAPQKGEHHDEAVSIVGKHSKNLGSERPGVSDRHEGQIQDSKHNELHKDLTSAGYKHKYQSKTGDHTYKKGATTVLTTKAGDEDEGHSTVYVSSGRHG